MNPATVHCPYCNSQLTPQEGAELGTRISCPRCGERFVYRSSDAENITSLPQQLGIDDRLRADVPDGSVSSISAESLSKDVSQPVPSAPGLPVSNRVIAFAVLGVMAAMALVGGVYAWRTVVFRRLDDTHLSKSQVIDVPLIARVALGIYVLVMALMVWRGWNRRDRKASEKAWGNFGIPAVALAVLVGVGLALVAIQQRPVRRGLNSEKTGPESVPAVAPSQLTALGYLPDRPQLIIGFHVAEAWQTSAGRPFLDGSRQGGGLGLDQVESLTSLKPAEIDHAVMALKLDKILPRVFLIVRTIHPYNPAEIQRDLKATKMASAERRTLYEFNLKQVSGKAALWFADGDKTLVVAWPSTEMKEVPDEPRKRLNHLSGEMQKVFEQDLDPAAAKAPAQIWAAGHVDGWDNLAAQLLLAKLLKDAWGPVSKIKTAGIWMQLSEEADVHAVCRCADADAAEKLRVFLLPPDQAANKGLAELLPQKNPFTADLTKTLKATQDGDRLSLEANVSSETIRKALEAR